MVTLVGAIETVGDGVAIQRVSQRRLRATDFRVVQGALNADGVGNLLSGLLGTLPNTTYSTSISLAEVTGIGARRVGVVIGVIFVAIAFFPKFAALLIAIPAPVAASYITVLIGMLFVQGMKIVIQDGVGPPPRRSSPDSLSGSARASRTSGSSRTCWERGSWACCSGTA